MIPPTIETDRLTLRPLDPTYATDLHAIYSDERAMRFMPTPTHTDITQTQQWLARDTSHPEATYWVICQRGSDTAIGTINYLGGTRVPGMGYLLHPDHWGKGYTPEAARVALNYGFEQLGYDRVELWIDETNAASIRVAQKLGFRLRGRLPLKYAHRDQHHFMQVYGCRDIEWLLHSDQAETSTSHTRFFHIEPVLMVHDVDAATAYYRDKLGFNIDFVYGDPPDHAAVSRGEWSGSMVTIQLTHVPADKDLTPAGHLYVMVDTGLDQLCAQYRERGVHIRRAPQTHPWGMREFSITDLYGHILVFGTHA